jgi:translation elongation factor P/translation initiation factor 5A
MLTASEPRAGMALRIEGTLYKDDRLSCFMRPETFEQIEIENARLGRAAAFLLKQWSGRK